MTKKIRKGDTVEIISGRFEDKGQRGEVINVIPQKHRVVVQGINLRVKNQQQVQTQGRTINPGRITFEGPLDVSNVMLICPKCDQPTRVTMQRDEEGAHRVCKKCQAMID
jgi:large subunit ribosomal protein L24